MTYSKLYFGKELDEVSYEDIENFFVDEKDESNKIEFKSYYNPDERNHTEKENGVIRSYLCTSKFGRRTCNLGCTSRTNYFRKKKKPKGALSPADKLFEKKKRQFL